jgi:HEAT repeat protein
VIRTADLDERRAALLGIGLHPDDAAIPFLLEGAASRDVASRMIALSGLARRPEGFALDVLAAAALDDQHEIRNTAVSLLGERVDRPAAETVVDLALGCEPHHPVHQTLSRPGAARIDAIAARLALVDDRRASILAAALARMRDHAATKVLLGALRLANPSSRRAAATMLVAIGAAGSLSAVARIASEDPDRDVRCVCAALVAK